MWYYKGKHFKGKNIDQYVGMVYLITNLDNNKKYIGQKMFSKAKRYQKNKKKKTKRVESNWDDYTGSNEQLNQDILNGANIKKQILHLCTKKSMMNYLELKEQVIRNVIFDISYYNAYIGGRINRKQLGIKDS